MKKLSALVLTLVCATTVGCSTYAAVGATTDGKALVAKNGFFGKSVYVCTVTPGGLTGCQEQEAP